MRNGPTPIPANALLSWRRSLRKVMTKEQAVVAYGVNRSSALTIKGIVETADAKNKYSVRFTVPSDGNL